MEKSNNLMSSIIFYQILLFSLSVIQITNLFYQVDFAQQNIQYSNANKSMVKLVRAGETVLLLGASAEF
jgi:hypothetical protein